MNRLFFRLLPLLILFPFFLQAQLTAKEIVKRSIESMTKCKTNSGRIVKSERVKGGMVKGDLYFKVQYKPYKAYVYTFSPDVGAEVLYKEGWNKNKVYIHPNKFPFVNISLAPFGDLLIKDKHHSIFDVGFVYTNSVLKFLMETRYDEFDKYVKYARDAVFEGMECYVITIDYQDYKIVDYTVLPGEDLVKIDQKLRIPAYKILELNRENGVKDFFDVKAGDKLKVPNSYGKKVIFFIDKKHYLPVVQIIHDELGLFEKYEYVKVKYNPVFAPTEFDTDWHEYDF